MTHLLDTSVLSETRKRQPAAGVADWIAATPSGRLHVSVLTLARSSRGSQEFAAEGTGIRLPPSSAGSGIRKLGSKTGFSRLPLPGAVSSTRSPSR